MNAVDHNNVVIFDDRGIPSIMCRFVRPKDTEEVPAVFKIGDKVADAIYISKYPNIVIDGRAYSMPMADPTVNITFDGAVQACRCKGLGWHLMTAVEYEYLLNQSREKGTMPHGNTDWGKDYYHNDEQGKVSNLGRTYTGTGPVLLQRLQIEEEGPGYCHFPKDENEYIRGYDEDYFKGLTAEKQVLKYKKGRPYFVWELTGETKRNEPLDCRNYAQAAIEITGLTLKEPPKKKTEVQVTRKQTRRRGNRSGGIA